MTKIKFKNNIREEQLQFAVIVAKMHGKWVLCKHRDRVTYEFPGGHRENGESIFDTAKRELKEETGAINFTLQRICNYSVCGKTREGEQFDSEQFGALFYAEILTKEDELYSEIETIILSDDLPDNWTYSSIMPQLIHKVKETGYGI
ncbi:MAG: NUDIX domain-containing protein [Lachnospiraceae bacterium]|nr:NUDIX domain-containing protein [Lachnospiraceae bacterium]